jgi:thiol-disulfide isomerase/thioredoxin
MPEIINHYRRRLLGAAIAAGAGSLIGTAYASSIEETKVAENSRSSASYDERTLSSLKGAIGWVGSPALSSADLRGKVVLVEFLTFTCINWLRTLPYVRAWAHKYGNSGLVVIGAHTPEFGFEKDPANARSALQRLNVDFPVAIDSDFAIWSGFDNRYWPALYFIDANGKIRHHQFGEGDYVESERVIQRLLTEAGFSGFDKSLVSVDPRGIEAPADPADLRTGETYVGYDRVENFASPGGAAADRRHVYAAPKTLPLDHWALAGDWTMGRQALALDAPGGRIVFSFHARDLHLVMGSPVRGAAVNFRVSIDGKPPGSAHGLDVDELGKGTAREQRLYQLIRQQTPISDRQFEIEFLDSDIEVFSFTFG